MFRPLAVACCLLGPPLGFADAASAQDYPVRSIRFVVPFAAGSATDALARILAQKLGEAQGWTVVVEDMPGASGMLAAQNVARAAADGHTEDVPGYELTAWFAAFLPAKTSKAIVGKLNAALNAALTDETAREALLAAGIEPVTGSPEELRAYVVSETAKWAAIVKSAGIQPE